MRPQCEGSATLQSTAATKVLSFMSTERLNRALLHLVLAKSLVEHETAIRAWHKGTPGKNGLRLAAAEQIPHLRTIVA